MAIFNSYVSLPEGILQIMECMEWTYYMSMCASQNMFFLGHLTALKYQRFRIMYSTSTCKSIAQE